MGSELANPLLPLLFGCISFIPLRFPGHPRRPEQTVTNQRARPRLPRGTGPPRRPRGSTAGPAGLASPLSREQRHRAGSAAGAARPWSRAWRSWCRGCCPWTTVTWPRTSTPPCLPGRPRSIWSVSSEWWRGRAGVGAGPVTSPREQSVSPGRAPCPGAPGRPWELPFAGIIGVLHTCRRGGYRSLPSRDRRHEWRKRHGAVSGEV